MPFPDVFKVFDSHSRDLYGMSSMSGFCVLISVEGIQNLVQHFHLMSQSSESNDHIPFELNGVTCVRVMDVRNVNVQHFCVIIKKVLFFFNLIIKGKGIPNQKCTIMSEKYKF